MTSDLVTAQARVQDNVVARWALLRDGMTRKAAAHAVRDLREIHDGVYLFGEGIEESSAGAVLMPTRR